MLSFKAMLVPLYDNIIYVFLAVSQLWHFRNGQIVYLVVSKPLEMAIGF